MESKDQPPRTVLPLHASTSEAVTNNVRVEVKSQFAPDRSQPFESEWFFYYTIRITNEGTSTVQLISRHWIATDAAGQVDEVTGPGVVGEQPALAPGESFQYTSGWPLRTASGVLRGTYQMVDADGRHFDVEIAPFALHEPYTVH
jgi:ApaG protein